MADGPGAFPTRSRERVPPLPGAAFDVVAVAASAGGLRALDGLLSRLPADFPAAILVVQHLDPRHRSVMHEILGRHTPLRVVQAEEGQRLEGGTVYVAPPDRHLLLNEDATLSLSRSALVHFVRPSADLLFDSVAAACGDRVIAVVLTGTGSDGSLGVQAVKKIGGTLIVQDGAEFTGMPEAALRAASADLVLRLEEIPLALLGLVRKEEGP